jgi:hypothetical protein
MMFWLGYLLALLAAIVVGWALPLVGAGLLLPLLQIVYTLNPWVATGVMAILGGLLVYYSISRQAWWQAAFWATIWGMGAVAAIAGVFHWYALLLEVVVLVILLVPGVVAPGWLQILRWFAAGELGLTLLFLWGQGQAVPGIVLVTAVLLLALSALVGSGAYRPYESRRMRRRLATMAAAAAVVLVLWQPILIPAAGWMGHAIQAVGQTLSASPLARWYRVTALRWERREIGETAKTAALQGLQGSLTEAHRRRWEKAVGQIPELPLSAGEWGDLGIPRDADP